MFHFGFSYVGFIYLIMLFVPNIIWMKNQPKDYEIYAKKENRFLQALEKIGEVLATVFVLIFSDFNPNFDSPWIICFLISFALMLLYEVYWVSYFRSEKTMSDFYRSILGIPVAGATLPVCAFFWLGLYGGNSFLMVATMILGVGHIGIHYGHHKEISGEKQKKKRFLHIIKWVAGAVTILFFGLLTVLIGFRNINYINGAVTSENGVEEGIYVTLGGQEQYLLIRGADVSNPVIVYLHGGPASPDSGSTYVFTDYLMDDYTVVCWDQRGSGRTYYKNVNEDLNNVTATFEQAKADLDELVTYVCDRFSQNQVIIMGHSYGTMLGSRYALEHPDRVSYYIGIGQVVSLEKSDIYSYEDALMIATERGDDTTDMTLAYQQYQAEKSLVNLMNLRSYLSPYHPAPREVNVTWSYLTSPHVGFYDLWWQLKPMLNMENFFALNEPLFSYTLETDLSEENSDYQMPVLFISGSCDWTTPVGSAEEYLEAASAPEKNMVLLEGCGHSPQYDAPEEFCEIIRQYL